MQQTIGNSKENPQGRMLSTAIIGGGKISEQHLAALKSIGVTEVKGVCDLSPSLAKYTSDRYEIDNWYVDYMEMLENCQAEVVHILTPPATHENIIHECLKSGRHVIVEKPIALNKKGFSRLWKYATERNLALVENHNYRFNKPIRKLEEVVNKEIIGQIEEVEVRMVLGIRGGGRYADTNLPHPSHKLPAGVIHEFITHLSYLLLNFLPINGYENIDTVCSAWRNHGGGELFKYDDLDATIMAKSVHGRIRFSCRQWPDCFSINLRGTKGTACAELFHGSFRVTPTRSVGTHLIPLVNSMTDAGSMLKGGIQSIWNKIKNQGAYEGLGRFLSLTYSALSTGNELPVNYDHMFNTVQLVDALLDTENHI